MAPPPKILDDRVFTTWNRINKAAGVTKGSLFRRSFVLWEEVVLKTEAYVCLSVCQWVCETHQQLRHFLTSQKCFLLRNLDPAGQFILICF